MEIKLHANATTTPRIRRYLQQSDKSDRELAKELGISVSTVRRWRVRKEVDDQKSTPKVVNKALRLEQICLALWLRTQLVIPLDELTNGLNQGLGQVVSRSSLDRMLKKEEMIHMNVLGARVLKGKKALQAGVQCGRLQLHYCRLSLRPEDGGQLHLLWLEELISGYIQADIFQGISAQLVVNWLKEIQTRLPGDIQSIETENKALFLESVFNEHPLQQWCDQQNIKLSYFEPISSPTLRLDIAISTLIPAAKNKPLSAFLSTLTQYYNQQWAQKKLGGLTPQQFWLNNAGN